MPTYESSFPQLLYPGLVHIWGTSYPMYKPEYSMLFPKKPTKQAYEKSLGMSGFGRAVLKEEGKNIYYDTPFQGYTQSIYQYVRGLGFIVTKEMYTDDQYNKINALPKSLKYSMHETKEWDAWSIINNGQSASYTGADGVSLINTLHPLLRGGYLANCPSTPSDLSYTALEQAFIDIQAWTNDDGLLVHLKPRRLWVTPTNDWQAHALTKSPKNPEQPASNAVNPLADGHETGSFPQGYAVTHYVTDTDFWGIETECEYGFVWYEHSKWGLEFTRDNDFGSDNGLYKATDRYAFAWDNPRCMYASYGSATGSY